MRQRITHYDALGVERDASLEEIRAAFRKLTLEHHPDRFQGDARLRAEERFQEITEAFNVLSRPDSRDKYDRDLHKGGTSEAMDRSEIARRLAAKGAQLLRDGKFAQAVDDLQLAIDHDEECARGHYFMGVALGKAPGRERDALRHVERAAALEPDNATMKGEAAALSLKVGLTSRAVRLARETLDLDPTSVKAQQVLETADESRDDDASEGLFGRFRKRS